MPGQSVVQVIQPFSQGGICGCIRPAVEGRNGFGQSGGELRVIAFVNIARLCARRKARLVELSVVNGRLQFSPAVLFGVREVSYQRVVSSESQYRKAYLVLEVPHQEVAIAVAHVGRSRHR